MAIVTNVGAGCGGRGSVGAQAVFAGRSDREWTLAAQTNGADAYGKTVWSWHPLLVSSRRRFAKSNRASCAVNSLATVTRRIRRRGERGISRKAIAQGTSECSACTCMLVCVSLCAYCTRDRGCSKHLAFPAPSLRWAKGSCKARAKHAARTRRCIRWEPRHCERKAIHCHRAYR